MSSSTSRPHSTEEEGLFEYLLTRDGVRRCRWRISVLRRHADELVDNARALQASMPAPETMTASVPLPHRDTVPLVADAVRLLTIAVAVELEAGATWPAIAQEIGLPKATTRRLFGKPGALPLSLILFDSEEEANQ